MSSIKVQYNIFLVLFLLGFFGLEIINYRFLDYFFLLIVVVSAYPALQSKTLYSKPILCYIVFVFLSCLYSWLFNGQALHQVVGHSYIYFALLFFFHLINKNLSYKEAESSLFVIAVCFCIAYILQWLIYPSVLFSGAADEGKVDLTSSYYRVRLPGSISCYFLFLYSINKFIITRKHRYVAYALLGFVPILVQGFRSLVALSVIAAFASIPFVLRNSIKTIIYSAGGIIIASLLATTSLVQSKYEEMMRRQNNEQTFENQDYIRFRSFDYYWNYQFIKPYEKVIGGGQPVDKTSSYKRSIDNAQKYSHFYWVDLGIVGLSMVIGMPAVILLVFMYLYCMWKCKEPQLQYIRFTLFVVLFGSIFTTMEIYREGNILLLSLFLYIDYKYHAEQKFVDKLKKLNYSVRKTKQKSIS